MNAHDLQIRTSGTKMTKGHNHEEKIFVPGNFDNHTQKNALQNQVPQTDLSQQKFKAAEKYSKRVHHIKKSLPLIGGLFIVIFIAYAVTTQILTTPIGIAAIDLTNGQVVMDRPSLSGFTSSNSEYNIVAEKAFQDLEDPKNVALEKIAATLALKDGNIVSIESNNGYFNVEKEKLRLDKGISIHTSKGHKGTLERANIDIKTGILTSKGSVKMESEIGNIAAESLLIRDNGTYMLFEDRVKMTIIPKKVRPHSAS